MNRLECRFGMRDRVEGTGNVRPMHLYQGTTQSGPDDAGQLVPDVRVGEWSMPWNARDGVGRLGPGIPKSDFWASAKEGIDQVGCVYTAQGFEFDYVGVIVGPDLVYRTMDGGWVGQRDQSHDRVVRRGVTEAEFTRYVKSSYRVPADPRPPRLLRLLHGRPDARLLLEPDADEESGCTFTASR